MTEIADRYRRRAELFESTVAGAPSERWEDQSPCAEWTARDVVGHVVAMHAMMLRPLARELSPAPAVGDDPLTAFRAARADIEALLDDPDLAAIECDTPMGRMTVERHVDEVSSADLVIHRWDLARATGQDETIDPAELGQLWIEAQAIPEEMRIPNHFGEGIVVFGPVVDVPDDASTQDRLLGLLGRHPG